MQDLLQAPNFPRVKRIRIVSKQIQTSVFKGHIRPVIEPYFSCAIVPILYKKNERNTINIYELILVRCMHVPPYELWCKVYSQIWIWIWIWFWIWIWVGFKIWIGSRIIIEISLWWLVLRNPAIIIYHNAMTGAIREKMKFGITCVVLHNHQPSCSQELEVTKGIC